jgi:hypothetical protein
VLGVLDPQSVKQQGELASEVAPEVQLSLAKALRCLLACGHASADVLQLAPAPGGGFLQATVHIRLEQPAFADANPQAAHADPKVRRSGRAESGSPRPPGGPAAAAAAADGGRLPLARCRPAQVADAVARLAYFLVETEQLLESEVGEGAPAGGQQAAAAAAAAAGDAMEVDGEGGPAAAAASAAAGGAAAPAPGHGEHRDVRDEVFHLVDPADWTTELEDPPGGCRRRRRRTCCCMAGVSVLGRSR